MAKPLDLRLNAIVDPERAGGHDLVELARLVAQGGATLVQLRDKTSDTRPMIEAARAIKAALAPLGVPFVVNDRVDVALAARADGVHIGPDDMTPEDARALLGPDAIIGVSIKSVAAAEAAPIGLVDYAGVGGVYTTLSKAQENPADRNGRACAHCLRLAPPRAESPGRRYRRHRCRQCGCGDRRRRRRCRRHLGAVARARSGRRRARAARSGRRHAGEARHVDPAPLVPAKAGTQLPLAARSEKSWLPACAGMSGDVGKSASIVLRLRA